MKSTIIIKVFWNIKKMNKNKAFLMIIRSSKPSKILSKMFNSISLLFKKIFPYLFNMKNFETNLNIGLGQILSSPFLSLAPDQYLTTTFKLKNFFYDR
jgi:hypothetical protein